MHVAWCTFVEPRLMLEVEAAIASSRVNSCMGCYYHAPFNE